MAAHRLKAAHDSCPFVLRGLFQFSCLEMEQNQIILSIFLGQNYISHTISGCTMTTGQLCVTSQLLNVLYSHWFTILVLLFFIFLQNLKSLQWQNTKQVFDP